MSCSACGCLVELDAAFCGVCGSPLRTRRRATLVGDVLADQYRIDAKIAEGGFGSIYQATHIASGLDVALKVLHAELAADPSLAARFRREGAALSRLHDPHTVATYDVGETTNGTLYIAMELLRGESLHDRMTAQGTIAWRDALSIIRDVCSSLAEAHGLGIVHRDLKPANIHLAAGDTVKLLDFGIAKVAGSEVDDGADLTRLGQTIGTLEYMAPEQIIGGSCEPRTDIYQLGVLMFEMITGRRPFAEATEPTAMITALLTLTPPAPSSVPGCAHLPKELDALILRCLGREPEHRFTNVRELTRAIVAILGLPDAATHFMTSQFAGEESTWVGGAPVMMRASAPMPVTTPPAAPAPMMAFDVPVRGSVSEASPLEGSGNVAVISDYIVEALGTPVTPLPKVSAFARTAPAPALPAPTPSIAEAAPPTQLSFATRVVLWTIGLAASGAAIGTALGFLTR